MLYTGSLTYYDLAYETAAFLHSSVHSHAPVYVYMPNLM